MRGPARPRPAPSQSGLGWPTGRCPVINTLYFPGRHHLHGPWSLAPLHPAAGSSPPLPKLGEPGRGSRRPRPQDKGEARRGVVMPPAEVGPSARARTTRRLQGKTGCSVRPGWPCGRRGLHGAIRVPAKNGGRRAAAAARPSLQMPEGRGSPRARPPGDARAPALSPAPRAPEEQSRPRPREPRLRPVSSASAPAPAC